MGLVRTQVVRHLLPGDPERDAIVNDVWHTIGTGPGPVFPVDYDNHANEMLALFSGQATGSGRTFLAYSYSGLTIKVYEMSDPKPRVPRSTRTYTPSTYGSGFGPRESACCLSYYHLHPSIKTERGRIYVGPFNASDMTEHVPLAMMQQILDLGHGLFDIGGENVAHVVWSHKLQTSSVVQNYWVNSNWDVQRSRDTKEIQRITLAP